MTGATEVLDDTIDVEDTPQGEQTAEPLVRKRVLIPNDDGRKLMRAFRVLDSYEIQVIMRCNRCGNGEAMPIIEATRAEETNELLLVCGCTLRILENVR